MGLSSKQVSRDGVGWNLALLQADHQQLPKPSSMKRQQPTTINQQQQAAAEPPLKCPRCDSTNTKFCYYNNYNKAQPRHFCKACKRHWTKGGTLRNVPIGGGRKNKRIKTSNTSAADAAAITTTTTTTSGSNINNNNRVTNNNIHLAIQCHQQQQPIISRQNNLGNFVIGDHDQKNFSEILYQAMIHQHHDRYHSPVVPSSSNFIGSSSNHESSLLFPYSSSTSFDTTTTPSSISNSINQSSNVYNYAGSETIIDDPSSSTGMISSTTTQPWQVSNTSTAMDTTTTSFCNWDDIIDTFASSTQDLNIPNWVADDSHDHHTKP